MSNGIPRHLADPTPVRRQWRIWTGVGLAVVLVLAATAWLTRSSGTEADLAATASPPVHDATASTAANAQASGDAPKNLLPNPSFENGSQGWRPIGAARLTRSSDAHDGEWALRVMPDASADGPVGITVHNVTVTKPQGLYHTNAWVRPSSPGTTVTIGLREYQNGQPVPGSNTLGWTVEREGWRQFGAIHAAARPGSELALEITARDLPPGGYLDIDEAVLHLLNPKS